MKELLWEQRRKKFTWERMPLHQIGEQEQWSGTGRRNNDEQHKRIDSDPEDTGDSIPRMEGEENHHTPGQLNMRESIKQGIQPMAPTSYSLNEEKQLDFLNRICQDEMFCLDFLVNSGIISKPSTCIRCFGPVLEKSSVHFKCTTKNCRKIGWSLLWYPLWAGVSNEPLGIEWVERNLPKWRGLFGFLINSNILSNPSVCIECFGQVSQKSSVLFKCTTKKCRKIYRIFWNTPFASTNLKGKWDNERLVFIYSR